MILPKIIEGVVEILSLGLREYFNCEKFWPAKHIDGKLMLLRRLEKCSIVHRRIVINFGISVKGYKLIKASGRKTPYVMSAKVYYEYRCSAGLIRD